MSDNRTPKLPEAPLAELAKVIMACGRCGMTPVIVCGPGITLQPSFYEALCDAVFAGSGCTVRLDLLPSHRIPGVFSGLYRGRAVQRLSKRLSGKGAANTTIALSRVRHPMSEMVVGFAGSKDVLPSYAKSIELAA